MVYQTSDNCYSVSRFQVNQIAGLGNYITIQSAINLAAAGDTIFIMPGVYTENLVLKSGVNFSAFNLGGGSGVPVTINGKIIDNGVACNATFTGLTLQTNSDNFIDLTASGSSVILDRCNLNCTNNTGMAISTGATVMCYLCVGNLGTTGIGFCSGAGTSIFRECTFTNSGTSTTATTMSGGLIFHYTTIAAPVSITSTGIITAEASLFDCNLLNSTAVTTAGSGSSTFTSCTIKGGSASAISVGTGSTAQLYACNVNSSNTNAITGAGTVVFSALSMYGTSNLINTTTQTPSKILPGAVKVTSPGAYPYTTLPQDYVILVDTSSARGITLNTSPVTGQVYRIKDNVGSAAANNITITPAAGLIDAGGTLVLNTNYASVDLTYNGTGWSIS
jgi:hypothetical protein